MHHHSVPINPKRVVILGASGFVARALTDHLAGVGIECLSVSSARIDLFATESVQQLGEVLRPEDALVITSALTPEKGKDIRTFMKNLSMLEHVAASLARRRAGLGLGPRRRLDAELDLELPADELGGLRRDVRDAPAHDALLHARAEGYDEAGLLEPPGQGAREARLQEGARAAQGLDDGGALRVDRFHAIVTDLRMPGVSGIEIHDRIAAANPAALGKLVLISGDIASSEVAEFLTRLRQPLVQKPFDMRAILVAHESKHGARERYDD